MSRPGLPHDAVVYPCSDGQPMAETQIHGACMMYVTYALKRWFGKGGRADVHVGMNSFLYYEQGNPRAVVAPDVYVVVGAPEYHRDTYLLWNEPKGPDFVLEVTSASTRREDEGRKREIYASLGVSEYFLHDPRGEYLTPALRGFRLRDGEYRALPAVTVLPGRGVSVASEVLGLDASRRAPRADPAVARPGDGAGAAHVRGIRRRHAKRRPGRDGARPRRDGWKPWRDARPRRVSSRKPPPGNGKPTRAGTAEARAKKLKARLRVLEAASGLTGETGSRKPVR